MTIFFAVLFTIAIGIIVHDNLYANAKEVTIRVDGLKEGKISCILEDNLSACGHAQAGRKAWLLNMLCQTEFGDEQNLQPSA